MQDLIGRTLGHYRVVEQIGAGGMGEVFRAEDNRLDRDVAVKVLPEDVARDEERLARFEREAKLLASLSHQNIAHLYGLETAPLCHPERSEGSPESRSDVPDNGSTPRPQDPRTSRPITFLVMELAEGETLANRIALGPIPIDDALDYARQIAEGLEAAHERGIIHRDLKPANVMLSPEGKLKILDFGLAKAWHPESSDVDINESPTLTAGMTRTGTLLGTAAYMSPEQARGKAVDKRTDVWAFGCVLYELLTRQRAFQGDDASQIAAAILRDDPKWVALPPETPRHVRRLLKRCLVKRPHDRLHDIADARIVLGSPLGDDSRVDESISVAPSRGRLLPRLAWLLTAAVPAIVVALLLGGSDQPSAQPVIRAKIGIEPAKTVGSSVEGRTAFGQLALSRTAFALSPDGRFLVYSAGDTSSSMLHLRALNESASVPLEGTESAWLPFFSPDGEWIGFWVNGELRRVRTTGGPAETICAAEYPPGGASWGPDGSIVFDLQAQEILRVDAEGGEPEVVTTLEDESVHILPHLLHDGETLLFGTRSEDTRDWKSSTIVAQSLSTGERSTLINWGSDARYTTSGHLVFIRHGDLVAAPFDPRRLELTGPPVIVLESVRHAVNTVNSMAATFSGQFSISDNGTLAHIPGGVWPNSQCAPVWVDRNGQQVPLKIPPGTYFGMRISPDNRRVIISSREERHRRLWVFDISRETFSRLTLGTGGDEHLPVWTPDGERIAYQAGESTGWSIHWIASDGSGDPEPLTTAQGSPSSWSPDGDSLVFVRVGENLGDIWLQPLGGEARPLIESPYSETCPAVSPDGRWVAFQADYTGRPEVYVTSFPKLESRVQISAEGGFSPCWGRDGSELFFRGARTPDRNRPMMVADVTAGSGFSAGQPRELFSGRFYLGMPTRAYDIAPDGQRFLMCKSLNPSEQRVGEIHLTLNWFEELERLAPTE